MDKATQLLCTFCEVDKLDSIIELIKDKYEIAFGSIYILENLNTPNTLCCTYNVMTPTDSKEFPLATISLHRKKATNTLYTINALNMLVAELNEGKLDRNFKVNWEDYRNCILVAAYDKLKKINTRLKTIIKLEQK